MTESIRYMSELFRIISGALNLDANKVRNYAEFLADKLESDGDVSTAKRLRKLLSEKDHQLHPTQIASTAPPVDGETRFPLLEKINLNDSVEPKLVLSQNQFDILDEFVCIAKSQSQFETLGINTPLALLLYGPPGCGKSRLAREISRRLNLPLYIARLDGLISSYLGNTSKNIRAIFEFVSKRPCVLFLDEFDAIAKLRDDAQELGELKRVVNSFLQNLDSIGRETIVIAATNHEQLLDSAVWRRFNYRLDLKHPDHQLRKQIWNEFLKPIEWQDRDMEVLADLSEGFTGSDIKETCLRLQRYRIIQESEPTLRDALVGLTHLIHGNDESNCFLATLKEADSHTLAQKLKERNKKLYSHSILATLFDVSKATSCRWLKQKNSNNA